MSALSIPSFLKTLRGKHVYFDPLHGNHGDRLLTMAARHMLENAPFTLASNPQSSNFILINGGGSMADGWFGLEILARYNTKFPSHPLAVLPSSFHLTGSSLADIMRARRAPLWLWAREKPSLQILQNAGLTETVHLGLDHDLVFSLAQHSMIRKLKHATAPDRILVVERDDWEGATGRRRPFSPTGLDFIPEGIRTVVRKTVLGAVRRRQDRASPFRQAALRFVHEWHPEAAGMVPLVADISLAEECGFEDFLSNVARASIIITTRLHVAILGQLLNRRTYLVEGSYHKFRGVFEYSMQQASTELLLWNGRYLEKSPENSS
jgi:exopolysaccharide biosynthesis predicted pyruvyltransferase EpsI